MQLLRELQEEIGMSVILISHDLGLVAEFAERVVVMYAGQVVEQAMQGRCRSAMHPYTEGLLKAIPDLENEARAFAGYSREYSRAGSVAERVPFRCALRICAARLYRASGPLLFPCQRAGHCVARPSTHVGAVC